MTFGQAVSSGFAKYLNFSGRAGRSEFWFWMLFLVCGGIASEIFDTAIFVYHAEVSPLNSPLNTLFMLATLVPSFAVAARRLHDTGRSGFWLLFAFTGVGVALLLYWQTQRGTAGANRYGPAPLATA